MRQVKRLALVMISNFGRADGGRETWAYQFLPRLLQRHPHLRIDVCGLRVEGQDENRDALLSAVPEADRDRLGITFLRAFRNKVPNSLDMIRAMRRSDWPSQRPDLALGVGSFVELLAMMAAPRLRGVPKAIWLRTVYVDEKAGRIPATLRPLARAMETAVLRRAQVIIANGEDTADHYRRRGLAVEVIANAVDLERWKVPPPKFEVPIDVAFIGRLTAVKGVREYLELCRRVAASDLADGIRFHIVGEGELAIEAQDLATLGMLRFHGPIDNREMPAFLNGIDAAVALTVTDPVSRTDTGGGGVSNALLEQMAAGRLVICWNNPAFAQVVRPGEGIVVQQGSVDGLFEALELCIRDRDAARRIAACGQSRAASFDWETHLAKFDRATAPLSGLTSAQEDLALEPYDASD